MQAALSFVAILSMVILLLCGTRPTFILLAVLAAVSAVCCMAASYILRKKTDEMNAKGAALQKKITNWRKIRRRQLKEDAKSKEEHDDMFDAGGVTLDLRLADAKNYFSKRNCVAAKMADGYLKGSPIRQELLEKALAWIADRDGLESGQRCCSRPSGMELLTRRHGVCSITSIIQNNTTATLWKQTSSSS